MAEHDSDREGREPDEPGVPFDEDAVWRAIVAGYGDEPPDPPGSRPFRSVEDLALPEKDPEPDGAGDETRNETGDKDGGAAKPVPVRPLGSSVTFAPGVGPRDHSPAEPSEAAGDSDDSEYGDDGEGHFVPPEPPPLPDADTTAKFAWLGVVGGPVLLLLAVLLGWEMTWWLTTLSIGGFLGGFVTLVARMGTDDDDGDDPGRGAVV
ncbi:hypothetical protein ACFWN1_13725 [Streptomyces sp. NPDC058459]|uniref:hypothetical protein n=1 Tax=Streptomyces sp. NPDC058459 TaxID=3346508 RepID=UPI00364AF72F